MMDHELKQALETRFDRLKAGGDVWAALAAAGVLGLPFAEQHGGMGLDLRAGFAVLEVLGPRGLGVPYLEAVLLAGSLLDRAGGAQAAAVLPRVAAGEMCLAFGVIDGPDLLQATRAGEGWRLDGGKQLVIGGSGADLLVLIAATGEGQGAFLLDRSAAVCAAYPTIDGREAADLRFDSAQAGPDALLALGADDVAFTLDAGIGAIAAEAAAIMARLVTDTRDYCLQRRQFDQAIAGFQVIQHRLVDMHIAARQAAAAAAMAADALDLAPHDRARAISAAKVTIADAGRFVGQQAVQLHGGMGMTDALAISALFKRLTVIESEFGTRADHLARYMAQG